MSYFLLGNISNGDNISLSFVNNGTVYILTSADGTYTFVPFSTDLINTDIPIMTINGTTTAPSGDNNTRPFKLTDVDSNMQISADPVFGMSNNGSIFEANTTQHQRWRYPTIFLAGTSYTISTISDDGTTIPIQVNTEDQGVITPNTFFVLPENWWLTSSDNGCTSQEINDAILWHYCDLSGSTGDECDNSENVIGWTSENDCNRGVRYNYCSVRTSCSDDCRGPCAGTTQLCTYSDDNDSWFCQGGTDNSPSTSTPLWKKTWFIVLTIGIVIAIITIIIALIIHQKKEVKDKTVSNDTKQKDVKRTKIET